jgi:hypothetical protein
MQRLWQFASRLARVPLSAASARRFYGINTPIKQKPIMPFKEEATGLQPLKRNENRRHALTDSP